MIIPFLLNFPNAEAWYNSLQHLFPEEAEEEGPSPLGLKLISQHPPPLHFAASAAVVQIVHIL